jgi:2-C-methyl-D-erythritol 4-phosphate cytidylyltransferase
VVVVPAGWVANAENLLDTAGPWRIPTTVVPGGAIRQDSVRAGLAAADPSDLVVIHDAARPFVDLAIVVQAIDLAAQHGAAVVATPATDTVKQVDAEGRIESTPDRQRLWLAQTPQVFRLDVIRQAHEQAAADGFVGTDDSVLVERMGVAVRVVRGNAENRKITTADDLRWAEWLLSSGRAPH